MTVSTDGAQRISLLYEAAKVQGSLVSIDEVVHLMPGHSSEVEIEDAIRSHPLLKSRFDLASGYIVEKRGDSHPDELLSNERKSRSRASSNLRHARSFVPLLDSASTFEMVGVSGSTSYRSASRSRDLDFFCVAPSGTMWISLTKALLLSRAFALFRKDGPSICLSCVMDYGYARKAFAQDQGALFARDALETVVLTGEASYRSLLRNAAWISSVYPAAFAKRSVQAPENQPSQTPSTWARTVNRFLFILVGTFVGLKSFALNRRLAGQGKSESIFDIRKGEDHLIYESKRYAKLREHYSAGSSEKDGLRGPAEA